ncbi:MAG: DNA-directed RNA polymerase subunit omega [Oscillospiraceae bacterium]
MLRPSIKEILDEKESYYSFVLSISKRARDIVDESNKRGEILVEKPVKLAVEQFRDRKCVISNSKVESEDVKVSSGTKDKLLKDKLLKDKN